MVDCIRIPSNQEHQEFKASLGYLRNLRPAWATWHLSHKAEKKIRKTGREKEVSQRSGALVSLPLLWWASLTRSRVRERVDSTHSSRLLSLVAKKSQWQGFDRAAHITSTVRKQRWENERSTYLLLLQSRVSQPGNGPACCMGMGVGMGLPTLTMWSRLFLTCMLRGLSSTKLTDS